MPIDIARKEGHTQIEEYLAGLGRTQCVYCMTMLYVCYMDTHCKN